MRNIGTVKLETERLILRRLTKDDAVDAYNGWCCDKDVTMFLPWSVHESVNDTIWLYSMWEKEYDNLSTYRWIVQLKDSNELIGTIDICHSDFLSSGSAGLGYCYAKKYWGLGYGSEALKRVIKFLFEEVEMDCLFAQHYSNNIASGRIMQKAGMKYEATLKSRVIDEDNNRNDIISYVICKEDYLR